MANSFSQNNTTLHVGDVVSIDYRIKEGDGKERIQPFEGILTAIKGKSPDTRTITVRKVSKSGIGVERVFPVNSPFIAKIALVKKSTYTKAKLYFLQNLSDQQLRQKLYKQKKTSTQSKKTKRPKQPAA
jgi:large subunit ribosomal protein L19